MSSSNLQPFSDRNSDAAAEKTGLEDRPDHLFWGRHFIASYSKCNPERLTSPQLIATMKEAIESSGASVLSESVYSFPNRGVTAVFLLSESHASIHTYPEHQSCFVDLFTCGADCRPEEFDAALRKFLLPGKVDTRVLLRHADSEEEQAIS